MTELTPLNQYYILKLRRHKNSSVSAQKPQVCCSAWVWSSGVSGVWGCCYRQEDCAYVVNTEMFWCSNPEILESLIQKKNLTGILPTCCMQWFLKSYRWCPAEQKGSSQHLHLHPTFPCIPRLSLWCMLGFDYPWSCQKITINYYYFQH